MFPSSQTEMSVRKEKGHSQGTGVSRGEKNPKLLTPRDFLTRIYNFHHNFFSPFTNLPRQASKNREIGDSKQR